MRKKRRVSVWLLPIIAFAGMIGFLARVDSEPYRRKTKKRQVKDFRQDVKPNSAFVETQLIADLDELQLTAS